MNGDDGDLGMGQPITRRDVVIVGGGPSGLRRHTQHRGTEAVQRRQHLVITSGTTILASCGIRARPKSRS